LGYTVRTQLSGTGRCVQGSVKSRLKCIKEEEQKLIARDHVPTWVKETVLADMQWNEGS
jgi:hypothetical protein